jgi:hypothetical protein
MLDIRLAVITSALLLLVGCTSFGPGAINASRTDYNQALRKTDDEQLLLNLVRLRYRERPFFLKLTALNTQFSFVAGAGGVAQGGDDLRYGVNGTVLVQETPTVTYTPLQGADVVQRLLTPIDLETIFHLDTSGWSTARAFRILLEQINGVKNATRADGPTPEIVPDFERFIEVVNLLRELELSDLYEGARSESGLYLRFHPAALKTPAYLELTRKLELDPEVRSYPVTTLVGIRPPNTINLRFRSLLGAMYFLSQSVEVPARDLAAVTTTRYEDGTPFDWAQVTRGLMRIHNSASPPDGAAVAVRYRDSWFYIDDTDLDSKSTFSFIGQLFSLQSSNAERPMPVLTLPVGK